jgi:hypothetical protein
MDQDTIMDEFGNPTGPVMTWSDTLLERVQQVKGYTEANDRRVEDIAFERTFRAKPLPRAMLLSWADRNMDGGATLTNMFNQLNQFGWNLPEAVRNGYDTMTFFWYNMNNSWFATSTTAGMCGMELKVNNSFLGSGIITSKDLKGNKIVNPTWVLPNASATVQPNAINNYQGNPQPINSPFSVSIRGLDLSNLSVRLCDETLTPLTYVGTTPGSTYYFNLYLLLQ